MDEVKEKKHRYKLKRIQRSSLIKAREVKRLKKVQITNECDLNLNNKLNCSNDADDNINMEEEHSKKHEDQNINDRTQHQRSFEVTTNDADMEFDTTNKSTPEMEMEVEGRRVVDFKFFWDQIKYINNHNSSFGCSISNMQLLKEIKTGLHSCFVLKCNMCNIELKLETGDKANNSMDVNHGVVTGAIMTGIGCSNVNELLASIDLPILSHKMYTNCHDDVAEMWQNAAETSMLEAAKEEAAEAIACGDVKDGIPVITVVGDCCWSKRSYKTNYSALSGVAAIIGYKTGKVLYMGVKNKYCVICNRATAKNQAAKIHNCQKNHIGSSTSMEHSIIVEGFKTSIEKRKLIYGTLIADGDANTYKKILECRPYSNIQVQKIECINHLLRNYSAKLLNLTKDTSIPLLERKLLTSDRLKRLRSSITSAVRFRKAQNPSFNDQIINLKKDILNSPSHILGDHEKCESYFCTDMRKNEENLVVKAPNLFHKLVHHATQISFHSKSLLHNVNNNRAEQFNSIVAKLIGGKRVNFSLKNSYTARCYASVVSFNSAEPQRFIYKLKYNKSPGKSLKKIEMARLKRKQKIRQFHPYKRKLKFSDNDKKHYGEMCQKPDMFQEEYNIAEDVFLHNLQEQVNNKQEIERDTVLQAESVLWLELKRCLLTASIFSKVCKRRNNISSAPLVKTILYTYSLDHVPSIRHGKMNEAVAIQQLQIQEKIKIEKCGLFIDEEHFYLGASPDGLYEEGIVEVKCPSSAFGMNAENGILQKKIKFWNMDGSVNKKHDWYYQIQGQLHITKRNVCLFAIWTGNNWPLKVEKINKDDTFWKAHMETKLKNFYFKCLLPEIVDPRKARSMPLRSTIH